MQMKRTTQRQSRGEVSLEIILNPWWWRREVSRLKEDLKRMRGACWIVCIWWPVKISHLTGILQLFFSPKCEFVSLRPFSLLKIPQMKMVSCYIISSDIPSVLLLICTSVFLLGNYFLFLCISCFLSSLRCFYSLTSDCGVHTFSCPPFPFPCSLSILRCFSSASFRVSLWM